MVGVVVLNKAQLEILSKDVYLHEASAIQNIKFKSESELVKYLYDCKSNHDTLLKLSDTASDFVQEFKGDEVKSSIARDIAEYMNISCNLSLQTVRNYTLRIHYLEKIKSCSNSLMEDLRGLSANRGSAIELAQRATNTKNAALEFAKNYKSPVYQTFSKQLKDSGVSYHALVDRYHKKLYPYKSFKLLTEPEKFERDSYPQPHSWREDGELRLGPRVFEQIIMASGCEKVVASGTIRALGAGGISVIMFSAGLMVWEIFSSAYPVEAAVRDSVMAATNIGSAVVGDIAGAAMAAMVGIDGVFATVAGIATGFLGAFIIGVFVGELLDMIFASGGKDTYSTDGHKAYVAIMPDGLALARQIAH
ncbi:hypothetical protein ACFE04_030226 [Oxalis oulophora]